jgi:hypothetical protein
MPKSNKKKLIWKKTQKTEWIKSPSVTGLNLLLLNFRKEESNLRSHWKK